MEAPMNLTTWLALVLSIPEEDITVDGPQMDLTGYQHAHRKGANIIGVPESHGNVVVELADFVHCGSGCWTALDDNFAGFEGSFETVVQDGNEAEYEDQLTELVEDGISSFDVEVSE